MTTGGRPCCPPRPATATLYHARSPPYAPLPAATAALSSCRSLAPHPSVGLYLWPVGVIGLPERDKKLWLYTYHVEVEPCNNNRSGQYLKRPIFKKGMEAVKGMDDVPAPVLVIIDGSEGQEQPLIIERVQQIDGVPPVAAAMVNNIRMKKRQLYLYCWLLLVASVIIVTNHVLPGGGNTAAAIPGLAKFIVLLCSICLIVRAMN
ncbi:hypothetical protein BS78_K294600 [Paspalum vaginatum]|uniref:Uncharacterized protein n=1 Tax=Paspalum vaginatum TaxID=158149 RepID=A0A9W7XAI1_9POAL|nr:hypothetical protein BS78_K294600 [Paspalum vaginatum]